MLIHRMLCGFWGKSAMVKKCYYAVYASKVGRLRFVMSPFS